MLPISDRLGSYLKSWHKTSTTRQMGKGRVVELTYTDFLSLFTPGQLILTTNGSDAGEAEEILESDYSGEELTIGFNARYCLDVLGILEDQSICFELKDSLSPGIFKPKEGEGYIYVIMPMRV